MSTAPFSSNQASAMPVTLAKLDGIEVKDAQSLSDKTVFLKVRFGILGNSRKVSDNVLTTDADVDLLTVSKQLLDSKELTAIKKADTRMRAYLYNVCLPFDTGTALLPVGLIEAVHTKLTEYKTERSALVDAFILAYPQLCKYAAQRLGSLYSGADYPEAENVRERFYFDWQYVSFGVPGQLKGISAGLFEAEKQKAAEQMQAATEEITLLMRESLHELVSHLQDVLSPKADGKKKKLHETAITHLQEFLTTFDLRNVTNDAELAAEVAKVRALISGADVDMLRTSDGFREKIRAGMQSAAVTLGEMVEEKAGRKYRASN